MMSLSWSQEKGLVRDWADYVKKWWHIKGKKKTHIFKELMGLSAWKVNLLLFFLLCLFEELLYCDLYTLIG